ncbi:MAG TPA: class I adenylate-forming enzyme family protein [Burkholderiales bacterium]|nr:class I adenylate-forming enzyme family protein [Burkholderiales bacterium]
MQANSTVDFLVQAARDPVLRRRIAIQTRAHTLTYEHLLDQLERVAGALMQRGVRRGEPVALLAGRSAEMITGLFGILAAGGVACVLEERAAPPDLAHKIARGSIQWLLADAEHLQSAGELGASHVLPLRQAALGHRNRVSDLTPADDALLLFTSGSTGSAKGVLLTHGNVLSNAAGVAERTELTPDDRLLHVMPLAHTNGINNQLVAPFSRGAAVVLIERFRAELFFDAVAAYRPTCLTGVPTMYSRLLSHTPPREAMRGVRVARVGAAPISVDLMRAAEAHLGVPMVLSYGLSEATCTSAMNPLNARREGSVGTALPGQRIAIFRPGTLQPIAAGGEGEVCIAGPSVMKAYVPAEAAADGLTIEGGWLRTGDVGRLDSDGYLTITGRIKDIIIRGGENLSPGAIEAAIGTHPAVAACCVVGKPDADLGEVPVAYVIVRPGQQAPAPADLQALVNDRLSRHHVPQRVIYIDSFPENQMGKIDRAALKQAVAAQ